MNKTHLATRKASNDLAKLDWKARDFRDCFCAISDDEYRKSEWAKTSSDHWVACDVFAFSYCEPERTVVNESDPKATINLYIKLGLAPSGNPVVFVCSVHP